MWKTKSVLLRRTLPALVALALAVIIVAVVRYAVRPNVTAFSAGHAPVGNVPGDAVTLQDGRGGIPRTVEAGDAAPDFTVTGEKGSPVRLSDFRGRWLVLVFVRAHW